MKIGIVISNIEPESAYNALRFGVFARKKGDEVSVFLLGAGVELEKIADARFDVLGQARQLEETGGSIKACGTCLKLREQEESEMCPLSTMQDLYDIVRNSDKVLSF